MPHLRHWCFFLVFTALLPNDVFYYFHFSGSKIQIQPPLSCDVQIFHVCPLPQCATGWNSQRNWFQTILSFINGLGSTSTASQWSVSGKTTKDQVAFKKKLVRKARNRWQQVTKYIGLSLGYGCFTIHFSEWKYSFGSINGLDTKASSIDCSFLMLVKVNVYFSTGKIKKTGKCTSPLAKVK